MRKRAVSIIVVAAILAGQAGILVMPQAARAQIDPRAVPNINIGGWVGNVRTVDKDATAIENSIVEAGKVAAMNTALSYFSRVLNNKLQSKLGIQSYQKYQKALVESKYLLEAFADHSGDDAVMVGGGSSGGICTPDAGGGGESFCSNNPSKQCTTSAECGGGQRAGSINDLAADMERSNLKNLTAEQTRVLAAREDRSAKSKKDKIAAQKKLLVRASSLFASSVACGQVDTRALMNTAEYMAASSLGFTSKDINPRNAIDFYGKMARMGSPEADPKFWIQQFKDNAAQKESEARQAATLELMGSGLKSPQLAVNGKTKINKSLSLVTVGQGKAAGGLFDISTGQKYKYNTSNFHAFLIDVAAQAAERKIVEVINFAAHRLGLPSVPPEGVAKIIATSVAGAMANTFVTKIYNQVGQMIFQGQFLGESDGCRKPARLQNFTATDREFTAPGNFAADSDAEFIPGDLEFRADTTEIVSGDSVTLLWDASSLGTSGLTVTLSGGSVGGTKEIAGSVEDSPTQTTTYTLTATGTSINRTASVTVTVSAAAPLVLSFNPTGIQSDRFVKVSWNASSLTDLDEVAINPLDEDGLPPQGEQCYQSTDDDEAAGKIDFTMTVIPPSGVPAIQQGTVPIDASAKSVSFGDDAAICPGETAPIAWEVEGYDNVIVKLDGNVVGLQGDDEVGIDNYSLTVEEPNGCGVIASADVSIIRKPLIPATPPATGMIDPCATAAASGIVAGISTLMPRE